MNEVINDVFYYNLKNYKVIIIYKRRMRNINYRFDYETDTFKISAPLRTSRKKIYEGLEKFAPSLIKRTSKHNLNNAITDDTVYIFGNPMPYVVSNKNAIYHDHLEVKDKDGLNKLLKDLLSDYLSDMIPHYEKIMNVKSYKFNIRNMHTRHGSNRRSTSSLSFALSLVHYSGPIIDSVIIHELAHDIYFDHSKNFYNVVYNYCPEYKRLSKALNSKDFSYGLDH